MFDCRKQVLRKGDNVAIANHQGMIFVGSLVEDPEGKRWVKVNLLNRGTRRFKANSLRVLNLTAFG